MAPWLSWLTLICTWSDVCYDLSRAFGTQPLAAYAQLEHALRALDFPNW